MSCFGSGVAILNILHADSVKTSDLIENINLCQDLNRYQKMIRTIHDILEFKDFDNDR